MGEKRLAAKPWPHSGEHHPRILDDAVLVMYDLALEVLNICEHEQQSSPKGAP
jgi:hypothetical protein